MAKYLVKCFAWLIILTAGTLIIWQLLPALGSLSSYFHQQTDPASALDSVPNSPSKLYASLRWQSDDSDAGRKLEPFTRAQIASDYLRAWLQWDLSFHKNEPYGLKTYFVGPALEAVNSEVSGIATKGWQVEQVDTAHSLHLHFYSMDGSIISFTDSGAKVARVIRDKTGAIIFSGESESTYQVVMFLAEGTWHVRHWVRVGATPQNQVSAPLQTPPGFVGKQGISLRLNGQPYRMAGTNYYPKDTPWDRFWSDYDPAIIEHDFALIQSLHLNTIRIFIPFEQFGGARIEAGSDTVKAPLEKLADLLLHAGKHRLKVIVTLFDFHTDYSLLLWPQADRHLETILTRFKDNPVILAWDLKNEPDQDYRASGRELVNSWLTHVARLARSYDPYHLLTIGWSTPAAAKTLIPLTDFVSFQYYAPASELSRDYASLRTAIPEQPIVLIEFGLSTWNSYFFPGGHSELEQATYYADILRFWRASDSFGYLAWTLYDFSYVPHGVGGYFPWQNNPQREFGIVTVDGKFKPAAQLLVPGAPLNVPGVPGWASALKPFWQTVAFASMLVLVILVLRLRHGWVQGRVSKQPVR